MIPAAATASSLAAAWHLRSPWLGSPPPPRPPAEISGGQGADVLDGGASIVEPDGRDVTALYLRGAQAAVQAALQAGCRIALITDGSPSCGTASIHDGHFRGRRRPGDGVAATLLKRHGIHVFGPDQIAAVAALMDGPDAPKTQERENDAHA